MMIRPFSIRPILYGVLLGLLAIGVWIYYPDLEERFTSSAKALQKKAKTLSEGQAKKLHRPAKKISVSLTEGKNSQVSAIPEDKGPIDAPHQPSSANGLPVLTEHEKAIQPYYAREESKWQELMRYNMKPKHANTYPYHECFEKGASAQDLPLGLVLGLSAHLSHFDPDSFLDHKTGIMHLGWPEPAKEMGVQKRNALKADPCMNIRLACRLLGQLFSQCNGKYVPALVAYRDQVEVVRPDRITRADLLFSAQLLSQVESVLEYPFERKVKYPLLAFDNLDVAEAFMASIKRNTGVALWISQRGRRYMTFVPAVNEENKVQKANLIHEKAGLCEKQRE